MSISLEDIKISCQKTICDIINKENLFSVNPLEINRYYVENLRVVKVPEELLGESIICTFKTVHGRDLNVYQVVVKAMDVYRLCFSIKCAETMYPIVPEAAKLDFKLIGKVYIPTMQFIRYDDSVVIPKNFPKLLTENLLRINNDESNFDFMINFIMKEIERLNYRYNSFDPKYIIPIHNYLQNNFMIINEEIGIMNYWMQLWKDSEWGGDCMVRICLNDDHCSENFKENNNGLIWDMDDLFYYIKSADLRNYLHTKHIFFSSWDQAYLLWNSGLCETSIIHGLEQIIETCTDMLLIKQISERIEYMKSAREEFRSTKKNQVFMLSYLDNNGIYQPILKLFSKFDICLDNAIKGKKFKILKLSISTKDTDQGSLIGSAQFDENGTCISHYLHNHDLIIEKDLPRFEDYSGVEIPHPFRKGNIVTDGKDVYYVDYPCCEDTMIKKLEVLKKNDNYLYSTEKFKINCYGIDDNGSLYYTTCDIRNISVVDGSRKLKHIKEYLMMFKNQEG